MASAPADDLELLPAADERVVTDLLALDTYESVMLYLDGMKEDGRLMYGRLSTLVSPQEAYLVIVKDGHLVTILDPWERPAHQPAYPPARQHTALQGACRHLDEGALRTESNTQC